MRPLHERFPGSFPHLTPDNHREAGPASLAYNCIAWAVGLDRQWWWPDPDGDRDWPEGVPRDLTLAAFVAAFATRGYLPCADGSLLPGVEKIALYADGPIPTHAARQMSSGKWTSKLGYYELIEHDTPDTLAGGVYGSVAAFLARPIPQPPLAVLTHNNVPIDDTFAEAFPMTGARVVVTAATPGWALVAAREATGYAASVIGCDCEAGIERTLTPDETPDGRPGVSLLFFAFSRDALQKALVGRVGQCILTCPTTACYNGLPIDPTRSLSIGGSLRYFGDSFQISKLLDGRRYWRIPVMDGEFVCEDRFGTVKGVAGGNLLILGRTQAETLAAAEAAMDAVRCVPGTIAPFPGGIVRSGSKVGSRYKKLKASTSDAYCPTLRPLVETKLEAGVTAVYEIVIDGVDLAAVEEAMREGMKAACRPGVVRITAGNYGGKLGPHHIHLHRLLGG